MNKIKLLVDGGCDLPENILEKYNIELVGLNVSFNDESYIAGVEIDNETFYKKMSESKELPKTSCPSPDRFLEAYKGDEDVLIITVSSLLSGTYSSAKLAKDMYEDKNSNKKIEVLDSMSGSIGQGLLAIKAAELINEGKNLDEIVSILEKLKNDVIFYGTLETLENAVKGGRISPLAGKIIGALNFKAIVQIKDGAVKPVDKARGESNSIKKVASHITTSIEDTKDKILCLMHADCKEKAEKLLSTIEKTHQFDEVYISEVGPVMGTYTSQGAVLAAVL